MLALLALVCVSLFGTAAQARIPDGAFVRAEGGRFVASGRPFAFVGANLNVMQGQRERALAIETLDAARRDGLTVGRIWALGEGPADASPWLRANVLFRAGEDGWQEAAFRQLDRVLQAARARGLRLIVTLSNGWPDYGGIDQYLRWAGLPDGESGPWGARDRFYSDPRVRALFEAHLQRIVGRINSLTGVRYADDPTIFAWELMNESEVEDLDTTGSGPGARARLDWISEMARFIRARDPHHLVASGVTLYGTRAERAAWLAACRLPAVDYCDAHLYPQGTDLVESLAGLDEDIDDRAQLAEFVAQKPIVFGELGFDTRGPGFLGRPRARWFSDFLGRAFFDGAAGALVWIYQPWLGRARDYGIYVDRRSTDDVRATLRGWARRIAAAFPRPKNPLLAAAHGDRLLYDPYRVLHRPGRARVIPEADGALVEIDPTRFATGRFERVGSWTAGPLAHAYGSGDGWFEWRFPGEPARALSIRARISSEFPGNRAPPDGGSRVLVSIDGTRVGALAAPPDDGAGRVESLSVTDPSLLAQLRSGSHTLRFEVAPGPAAHGVCVYGAPTGHGPPPVGEALPIELRFTG